MVNLKQLFIWSLVLMSVGCAGGMRTTGSDWTAEPGKNFAADSVWECPPVQRESAVLSVDPSPAVFDRIPALKLEPYRRPVDRDVFLKTAEEPLIEQSGWRVQVFAGRDQTSARRVADEIEVKFSIDTYLLFEAPQYKVRVGNFGRREEADEFCAILRNEGFRDAWVVKSIIQYEVKP